MRTLGEIDQDLIAAAHKHAWAGHQGDLDEMALQSLLLDQLLDERLALFSKQERQRKTGTPAT